MSTTFLSKEMAGYYEDMWIAQQLEKLSNGRYWFLNDSEFGVCKKDFWSIISSNEWEQINFHFELRWTNQIHLTEDNRLNLRVDLETNYLNKLSEETKHQIRCFFTENGCELRETTIKEINGTRLYDPVIPDFSSEESAIKTIQKIIEVLDSEPYQKCARIADECVNKFCCT